MVVALCLAGALCAGCGKRIKPRTPTPSPGPQPAADAPTDAPPTAPQKSVTTVHVFVALCDNEHQGIVPVSAALGDGHDPANNLYWGAMYGVRSFLARAQTWTLVTEGGGPQPHILKRAVFRHTTHQAFLVADAYLGARIKAAVTDFLVAAAGGHRRVHTHGDNVLGLGGSADMVAYVGHNGLMDVNVRPVSRGPADGDRTAIVLACKSKPYFLPRLRRLGCRPVLLTTGFMAPEAYTLEAALEAWLADATPAVVRERAAAAYNRYQKCGIAGARRLFFAGAGE